jgi:exonuclease SbcC
MPCGSLEHPNVMQAEDVSEQLTTIETILKLAEQEKKLLRLALKLKIRADVAKTCFT